MKLIGLNDDVVDILLKSIVLFEDKKDYLKLWFAFEPFLLNLLERGIKERELDFIVNHNDTIYKGVKFDRVELVKDYIILYCNFTRE